jgi:hypothetical protein
MEVKQQHMSHKTHHKPCRRFHYSLKPGGHEERIPDQAQCTIVKLMPDIHPA